MCKVQIGRIKSHLFNQPQLKMLNLTENPFWTTNNHLSHQHFTSKQPCPLGLSRTTSINTHIITMSRTSLGQRNQRSRQEGRRDPPDPRTSEKQSLEVKYQQPTLILQEEIESFLFMADKYAKIEREIQYLGWEPGQNYCSVRDDFGVCVFPNGDRYVGEWRGQLMEGMGLYFFQGEPTDRLIYLGDFQGGRFSGIGKLARFEGEHGHMLYYGSWQEGKRSHLGTHYYPGGAYYFGYWHNDRKQGEGKLIFPDGQFVGNWEHDQRHGFGRLRKNQAGLSVFYEGVWVNDSLPKGRIIYSDQLGNEVGRYQGELRQGLKHGQGTYSWPKASLEGQFHEDAIHGEGTLKVGKTVLRGQFSEQLEGEVKGEVVYECSDVFEGVLALREGKVVRLRGLYRFAGGDRAEGQFKDGSRGELTGRFVYMWANGDSKQFS